MTKITVEMDERGRCDWSGLRTERAAVQQVVSTFSEFLTEKEKQQYLERFASSCPLLWEEAQQVSRLAGVSAEEIVLVNVLYDLASSRCACTAFAIDREDGPLHGHCLDWEVGADALRDKARLFQFRVPGSAAGFISAGWPGFIGLYVGSAPGKFAVTVNAVWSYDERCTGEPLGMALRKSVATLKDYDELVAFLVRCDLACDCLLLVTGVRPGEMSIIERTPRRAAVRTTSDGVLLLTNHYSLISAGANTTGYMETGEEPFGLSTHERYARAADRLEDSQPRTVEDCFDVLELEPFSHDMTIQRIALSAAGDRFLVSPVSVDCRLAPPRAVPGAGRPGRTVP